MKPRRRDVENQSTSTTSRSDVPDVRSAPDPGLRVVSAGCWVSPAIAMDRPLVADLLVEDIAWQLAAGEWRQARPSWWRRGARREWRDAYEPLADKRMRLRAIAVECGLLAAPARKSGTSRS